jgi:hypothetical protein
LYAQLQRQLREMQKRLSTAQTESRVVRDQAEKRRRFRESVRLERRARARAAEPVDFNSYRKRSKKR